jgi:hypothetical protein
VLHAFEQRDGLVVHAQCPHQGEARPHRCRGAWPARAMCSRGRHGNGRARAPSSMRAASPSHGPDRAPARCRIAPVRRPTALGGRRFSALFQSAGTVSAFIMPRRSRPART